MIILLDQKDYATKHNITSIKQTIVLVDLIVFPRNVVLISDQLFVQVNQVNCHLI